MNYFWSRYNLELSSGADGIAVFNTRSGAICDIEQDVYRLYNGSGDINAQMPYFEDLLDMGFIEGERKEDVSEDEKILRVVLSCTESCNLRCYYCFEENHPKTTFFEDSKPQQFIRFLKALFSQQGCKKLYITWFGGEPLLYFNEIVSLSAQIIEACEVAGVEYRASIVTNATLLTPYVCNELEKCKISKVQITFDGDCERFIENKKGNVAQWNSVMNCLPIVTEKAGLVLRFNMDSNNTSAVKRILKQLFDMGVLQSSKIIFARINSSNPSFSEKILSWKEFFACKLELISYLTSELELDNDTLFDELVPLESSCAMLLPNSIVIDSQGSCHKCEDKIGRAGTENICNSFDACIKKAQLNESCIRKSCKECVIYYICKGECQAKWDYSLCNEKIEYIKQLALLKIGR